MNQITYIADPKVLAIPIIECNEPLIDIKDYSELQYGEPPECELTKECYTKIRKSVKASLWFARSDVISCFR